MAAADKARYFLERTVPDLQELAKKKVFSGEELTSIVKKRSDFEHLLNGPGSKPNDYIRYAVYEMNLDALRKKRCQRLGVKSTSYSGQRTVFFILERATRKFPGDKALWLQYIRFCQQESANRKLARAFTSVLRLRPRDWGLWVLAAKHYAEAQGDMPTARGYLQRGIRFCADERQLYLQYAKLEMVYLAKLSARRRVLGLDVKAEPVEVVEDENTISLPAITAEDLADEDAAGLEHVDQDMLKRLADAPVLHGAIPIAIFDTAMKQFHSAPDLAERFFDLTVEFDGIDTIVRIQQHILEHLESSAPASAEVVICNAKRQLAGIDAHSSGFPAALSKSLAIVREGSEKLTDPRKQDLCKKVIFTFLPYLRRTEEIDRAIVQVLRSVIQSNLRQLPTSGSTATSISKQLRKEGRESDSETLEAICSSGADTG